MLAGKRGVPLGVRPTDRAGSPVKGSGKVPDWVVPCGQDCWSGLDMTSGLSDVGSLAVGMYVESLLGVYPMYGGEDSRGFQAGGTYRPACSRMSRRRCAIRVRFFAEPAHSA
jgi:hypothetical protein